MFVPNSLKCKFDMWQIKQEVIYGYSKTFKVKCFPRSKESRGATFCTISGRIGLAWGGIKH